jgi:hypothetical protein
VLSVISEGALMGVSDDGIPLLRRSFDESLSFGEAKLAGHKILQYH